MYYYIINPAAGRGTASKIERRLRDQLTTLGISGEFAKTTGPGDGAKMAEAAVAKGYKTIVAVGGDGTVNEVINGIKKDGIAVGIIPVGKINMLARKLGIYNWQQATEILASRRIIAFNLMAAGQHYFLSSLAVGFPADYDKQVETELSGVKARLRQIKQTLSHTRRFDELQATLEIGNTLKVDCKIFYLWITNQKFQNPLLPNKLIVSFSDRPTKRQISALLWQLMTGRESAEEAFTSRLSADRLVISTEPISSILIDGKLSGRTPVAVRLTDKKIRFICAKELAQPTSKH